jgi:magnesium chelatase family protein
LIFPAKFTLVAAMNPCLCGYYGSANRECKCSAYEVIKYQKKISGPLLDRIDLQIKAASVKIDELREGEHHELMNDTIKKKVEAARDAQRKRFSAHNLTIETNSEMSSREAEEMIDLEPDAEKFLKTFDKSWLSPRSYYRILKVARTIADIEGKETVAAEHLAEAFSYRIREEI